MLKQCCNRFNLKEYSMNKTELVNSLSEETTFSKRDVTRVLEALIRILERTLKKGGKVQWSGFGTFSVSRRPARMGVNPSTKERIELPETNVPKFKPGKNLKELVRSIK
jgi:DNA-binding protein HU-beta